MLPAAISAHSLTRTCARAGSINPILTMTFACLQQGFDPRGFGGGVGGSKRPAAPIPFDEAPIQVKFN